MTIESGTISDPGIRTPAPLVLHVTEAMGGGLEDAVRDFIRSAPQYRHALLFTRRGSFGTGERMPEGLVEVVDAGRGVRALARVHRQVVARLHPDVLHLHSAWAGLIGRMPGMTPAGTTVVYSPHSYYFEREDLPPSVRAAATMLERVLARRTAMTAAVSPVEADIARGLGSPAEYIPNIVRLPPGGRWTGGRADRAPEVLLVGRVTAQKDPDFLLEVVRRLRDRAPLLRWTWAGDGHPETVQRLRAAGVEVTGWIPRAECLDRLRAADVYLHTASWEGSPITLLEAAAIGAPIIARSIRALNSLGFDPGLRTPEQVAAALLEVLDGTRVPVAPLPALEEQARALGRAYGHVLEDRAPQPVQAEARLLPVRS